MAYPALRYTKVRRILLNLDDIHNLGQGQPLVNNCKIIWHTLFVWAGGKKKFRINTKDAEAYGPFSCRTWSRTLHEFRRRKLIILTAHHGGNQILKRGRPSTTGYDIELLKGERDGRKSL